MEEAEQIWVPRLVFENTKDKVQTVMDEKTTIRVHTFNASDFKMSDKTNKEAVKQYPGKDNVLVMSRFYNIDFHCEFQMHWYPFDSQTCKAKFAVIEEEAKFVHTASNNLEYLGPNDLAQYFLKEKRQGDKENKNQRFVEIELIFGRRLLSLILTIFLPTILMNIIGHCSNYFKPFFFESVISLNVTVMLVLTTMFLSVSNNLPKTAYVKMIDVWLMFNLFKPFLDIIIQTYIETLRVDEEREVNQHGEARTVSASPQDDIIHVQSPHNRPTSARKG